MAENAVLQRFCLCHLKTVAFQFYLQRKVGWMGNDGHVVFGKQFPGEKGNVRR
jgi:hypothetical protein